ncbi:uncharacterized protein LOC110452457 [Mizuhopecten yessoensis]|uniref:Cysteine and tyrosine-rich protein 1 n=1 Tax=Mizuhopecten yessoensis TaxID=6573 RepID=A0A210QJM9_MIZYE|nr:uncharacterized protein LOC110452457 [Mizuhopecten yessoensis]OWF48964.1 hypothetical protein KP79_PYT12427 [Mizuhopecten yessoensis]
MVYQYLLTFTVLITQFSEVLTGEYCTICSGKIYCDSGCCSTYGSTHCCPNTTAIVVGSVFGTFVVMVILASAFICYLQHRRNRLDTMSQYIVAQTQYYTEDFTGKDGDDDYDGRPRPVNKPTLPDASLFKDMDG